MRRAQKAAMEDHEQPEGVGTSEEGPSLTIRLEGFEGPLDLLLHLIKREELDIWNIPIAHVTDQYLSYLQMMKDLNINVAGEWLVMAATLIYIKSRMLLPPDPVQADTQEGAEEDPRKELVYQLLEHQKFKNAAQMLHTREEVENAVWHGQPQEVAEAGKAVVSVTLFELLQAFHEVVKRFEAAGGLEIDPEEVTIEQKLADLRRLFMIHDTVLFSTFFEKARSKRHLIVTFLALLELVRLREVLVFQERAFKEIHITRLKPVEEAS
jgi:segregation and condensation protein A